jgi:hypothetical protein
MDYAELRYYHVKIDSFETHPELAGCEALIDRQHSLVHSLEE